ncbi:MAG: hypothetical protein AMJ38_01640 [Dehalococcoidia bacterium DG_22]|nr:MAG: hypothetical protein AMJ38_01640 [Dehalococcoidia bacterium DG_22]
MAGAGLACCLVLALLWTARIALSDDGPVASHWQQEPAPAQFSRWFPLYDNEILFCLQDRAGVGVSDAWVQDNLSRHWGVDSQSSCVPGVTPDLRIIIEDFGSPQPAGWARVDVPPNRWSWFNLSFYQHCEISLNAVIFGQRFGYVWPGTSTFLPDVPEKTLLHEFGHCIGMSHREEPGYQGAMYPMMLYYPNEEDIASLRRDYDPWLFFGLIRHVVQVMGMAA